MGAATCSSFHHKVFGASVVEARVLPGHVQRSQHLRLWSGHHVRCCLKLFTCVALDSSGTVLERGTIAVQGEGATAK